MIRRALTWTLTSTLGLSLVLAGCTSTSNTNGSQPAAKETPKDNSTTANKVTIKMMHLWPAGSSATQNKIVNDIINEYRAANPNVTIEQEVLENEQYKNKMKVLATSNALPDVGFTWAAGYMDPYVKGDMFAPLDDLLQGDLKDKFVKGTTDAYAFGGKTYGLPVELNIVPVYYNKAIFAKYNLTPPKTYDEFKNIVKTLSSNGVQPIALGNKDRWTGSLWYMYLADRIAGSDTLKNAINRSGTFNDPGLTRAASEIQQLVDMNAFNKGFNGLSNDEGKAEFMNSKAAMYMMGTWELPNYTTNKDVKQEFKDQIGFFKFPTVGDGKGNIDSWVGGPGVGLFVANNSKVKDEAKKFVNFFVQKWGEHAISEAGVIPATKVDTSKVKLPQMYIDLLNELNKASNITLFADVQMKPASAEVHLNMIQALYGKAVTPEDFAKKHEDALAKEAK
ncbi:extracellular solute-binding protein [Paenibacillus cremeus]|uniref:Extracellular solute-binding protein n=1 Tax=Paenibacillus cremeus TaxID=2163881 RepID=A0A559K5U2_9BACL|nr:extracellular solute-binding protein [Paenibacillus cremeus]TVY07492.1 extracellular solute-binding protein [Paenibacillus cremeus]